MDYKDKDRLSDNVIDARQGPASGDEVRALREAGHLGKEEVARQDQDRRQAWQESQSPRIEEFYSRLRAQQDRVEGKHVGALRRTFEQRSDRRLGRAFDGILGPLENYRDSRWGALSRARLRKSLQDLNLERFLRQPTEDRSDPAPFPAGPAMRLQQALGNVADLRRSIAALSQSDLEQAELDPMLRDVLEDMQDAIVELQHEVAEAHRRLANVIRPGRVTDLDAANGVVKVAYAKDENGADVKTGWIRWQMRTGSQKEWDPPKVGEQVVLISPGGDISPNTWVAPGGFYEAIPKNHNQSGQYKRNVGDKSELLMTGDTIVLRTATLKLVADQVSINGQRIDHNQQGWSSDPATPSV
ncbi:MAG: phage baseplate assembly protein V [Bacteroidota bacterium]